MIKNLINLIGFNGREILICPTQPPAMVQIFNYLITEKLLL